MRLRTPRIGTKQGSLSDKLNTHVKCKKDHAKEQSKLFQRRYPHQIVENTHYQRIGASHEEGETPTHAS